MSSGKKQTVGYKYFVGFHAVLAHAGCYLRRIWIEDKEAWYGGVGNESSRISQSYLFGGDDSSGGVVGNFNYYTGTPDQQPDPYLEQNLGVGNVPAYRGVSSFVWKQGYIGNSNYMKDWKYRLSYVGGIKPNITNMPASFVIAVDCSKSITPVDFLRLKEAVAAVLDNLVSIKETYHGSLIDLRILTFDESVIYLDLIDFQPEDGARAKNFILSKEQVSGVSFSEMMGASYQFLDSTREGKKNFIIFADGRDVEDVHVTLAQYQFDHINHFCLYTQYIKSNDDSDLPYHIALSKLDNTPEDNWSRGNLEYGYHQLCPWVWVNDTSALINYEAWFGVRTGEPDMNPADMLWLCITNAQWGLGQSESMLDKDAFLAVWSVLNQEDMYMSIVFDDEGQIQNIINLICEHIDASCFVDKRTNKWTVKLIRDDYEVDSLVTLDESNVRSISDYEIRTAAEQVNQVTVTYWNKKTGKNATSTAQDPARIAQNGLVNKPVKYDGFTNEKTAYRAAERDLHALSSPLKIVTLNEVHPDFGRKLSVGEAFTWNWSVHGVDGAIMRVKSIDYGDAHDLSVKIEAIEDVFSTPMNSAAPYVPPYENPANQAPIDNPTVRVIELPYYDAVQISSESEVNAELAEDPTLSKVAVIAARPQRNSINADVLTGQPSLTYKATLDYCPTAILNQDIDRLVSTFLIRDTIDLDQVALGEWVLLDDEKLAVTAIDLVAGTVTVKRGVLDTVPQKHNTGTMLYFCDEYLAVDSTDYYSGESVIAKVLTNTSSAQLSQTLATTHSIELAGLANRPYPPGNFKINNQYFPDGVMGAISLSWASRNRLQQTGGELIGFQDSSITPEEGVTYSVYAYNNRTGELKYSATDITTLTHVIGVAALLGITTDRLDVFAVRDGYSSHQAQRHIMEWSSGENLMTFEGSYMPDNGNEVVLQFTEQEWIAMAQIYLSMKTAPQSGAPSFLDLSSLKPVELARVGLKNSKLAFKGPSAFEWRWLRLKNLGVDFNKAKMEIVAKFNRTAICTTDTEYGFGVFINAPASSNGGIILLSDGPSGSASNGGRRALFRNQSSQTTISSSAILSEVAGAVSIYDTILKTAVMRLSISDGQCRYKLWWDGDTEPATWASSATYTIVPGNISAGIILPVYGGSVEVDFISIGTDGDSAPLSYPGGNRVISGTLLKPDGSTANGYIVRCYNRATGVMLDEILSNTLGAFNFSLPIPQSEKVYCLGVDQLGNAWNAPIKDLISPISP